MRKILMQRSPVMLGLRFKKMSIRATVLPQGLVGATIDNSPMLAHVDTVSHLDGGQTVTDEDSGLILEQLAEFFKDLGFCLGSPLGVRRVQ